MESQWGGEEGGRERERGREKEREDALDGRRKRNVKKVNGSIWEKNV
jgi:hypothetical protein